MPRLTRTQKFAELRDSLANDKESSLQTKDLSNYEDRLNSITELLSPSNKTEEPVPAFEVPAEEPAAVPEVKEETDPKYTWTEFEETPIEALVDSFKNSELEQQIREFSNETMYAKEEIVESAPTEEKVEEVSIASTAEEKPLIDTSIDQAPVNDEPVIEENKDDIKPLIDETPYLATYIDNYEQSHSREPVSSEPLIKDDIPTYEHAREEVEEISYPGYYRPSPEIEALYKEAEEKAEQEVSAAEPVTEPAPAVEEVTAVEEPVSEDYEAQLEEPVYEAPVEEPALEEAPAVEDALIEDIAEIEEPQSIEVIEEEPAKETVELPRTPIEDFVDNHIAEHEAETNSYLTSMMEEVDQYNTLNGDLTISQLTNAMVNEIRHPEQEEVKQEIAEVQPEVNEEAEDEEFSNTVSMEIAKIMDEIDAIKEEPVNVPEPVEIPEPVKEPEPVKVEEPVKEEPVKEEHPVLAKTLQEENEEEVVEIKNLKELEAEPTRDTVSNTIPFVVATDDDEEEIEDDEEDGSNTILNIILIVLIIVLVAVLGLIVFYILKTKGVI
ncbi:MAG: hypothetical protein K5648_03670 [Erysipelotrichaceae bacterium]|nr:hypothetical protein [Erysipelotrichaceae bacterium]